MVSLGLFIMKQVKKSLLKPSTAPREELAMLTITATVHITFLICNVFRSNP